MIANNFNFLTDPKLYIITVMWVGFCILVEKICKLIYDKTKIWKIEKKDENAD